MIYPSREAQQRMNAILAAVPATNSSSTDRCGMTNLKGVTQLCRLCVTLQEMQPAMDERAGLTRGAVQSFSLSLSRWGLARPRTRMTVTVSLSEAPDVAMLATPMAAGKYTRGPEPTDRKAPAAKIVRHSKRFSDLGRVGRE
ncbi:hypothetical protein X777_15505 [Ooceraea biroi]|uniref:Uncharacterized protein n=1 Tax=Ooceraea biroi TaxID=2015173 RepID=A0A026VUT6_OOCBI|nr:hypothetical protein X777_15505 [Ooceraea biroi]